MAEEPRTVDQNVTPDVAGMPFDQAHTEQAPALDPVVQSQVGPQQQEPPGPRPATPMPESGAEPLPPSQTPFGVQPDVLRRQDVKELQPAPVVTGAYRVQVETAPPDEAQTVQVAPAIRTDSVGPGETMSSVAMRVYGRNDRAATQALYEANTDRIINPDALLSGTSLIIPDLPAE